MRNLENILKVRSRQPFYGCVRKEVINLSSMIYYINVALKGG